MTSWIILLIKQYIDIAKYLLISDAIFDLNYICLFDYLFISS